MYIYHYYLQTETALAETQKQNKISADRLTQLENDNITLYSKIRYLQSYGAKSGSGGYSGGNQPVRGVYYYMLCAYYTQYMLYIRHIYIYTAFTCVYSYIQSIKIPIHVLYLYMYINMQWNADRSGGYSGGNRKSNKPEIYDHNSDDLEQRYSIAYEYKLNPFTEFSKQEKNRKLLELSPPDRFILNTTLAFATHPSGRRYEYMCNISIVYEHQ